MRGVDDQEHEAEGQDHAATSFDLCRSAAREAADEWRDVATGGSGRMQVEATRRANLYDQLAELFDAVGEEEDLAQFEDRNTMAVRRQGGQ